MVIPAVASWVIRKRATLRSIWCAWGKRTAGVVTVMATCMLMLGSCSAPQNTSAPIEQIAGGQITPLLESTLSTPRWFTGTDGQAHLVYELMLTKVVPAAVTLSAVEVHSADSGATLIALTGDSLRAATSLAASPDTPTAQLPPSSVGVVWLDIPLGGTAVPAAITPANVRAGASTFAGSAMGCSTPSWRPRALIGAIAQTHRRSMKGSLRQHFPTQLPAPKRFTLN